MMKLLGASPSKGMYEIEPQEAKEETQKPFFPGRQGRILLHGQAIGTLGVVHPDVLARFGLSCPASIVEINVEPLLSGDQHGLKSQDSL
jgi:phenylalanyl-tRNA synthetase beta subunit